jgi:hypothetical protein
VLLDKSDFAVKTLSSNKGYNDTAYQELVLSCCVTGSLMPGIESRPGVVVDGIRTAAESCWVTAAGCVAVLVSLECCTRIDTVRVISADCEIVSVRACTKFSARIYEQH